MKKFPILWNNSWFTLAELIVSITLIVTLISWAIFYFDLVATGYTSVHLKARAFWDIQDWKTQMQNWKKDFPEVQNISWDIFPGSLKWFSQVLLTSWDETSGVILGAYDVRNEVFTLWDVQQYSRWHPAYILVNQSEIIQYKTDQTNFFTNLSQEKIWYFPHVFLSKLWITKIQNSQNIKIDIRFTTKAFPDFYEMTFQDILNNYDFPSVWISFIH